MKHKKNSSKSAARSSAVKVKVNSPSRDNPKGQPLVFGRGLREGESRDLTQFKISNVTFFSAYRNNADIYACVREYGQNVFAGGYGWRVPGDLEAEVDVNTVKNLNAILTKNYSWRALKNRTMRDIGVTANAYWFLEKNDVGVIVGVKIIDPRTMAIITDKYGEVYGYIQTSPGSRLEKVRFEPDEIIHFKLDSDPMNEMFGMSPLEPIIWEARTDASAMLSNYFFFENDATPAVRYILDAELDPSEQKKAIEEIEKNFKGVENTNKAAVLAGVTDIKTISISQKDMDYLNGRKFTTDKVCAAYGVPKFMLGYTEAVNNNNGIQLLKDAHESTFAPLEELFCDTVNRGLIQGSDLESKVEFYAKPRKFDESEIIERRALVELQNGAITLRQYKIKTGQEITDADEENPNFDSYIIHRGVSAVLLEDVGVDPVVDPNDPNQSAAFLAAVEEMKKLQESNAK